MRFYNVFADVQLAASWLVLRAVALVPALLVVTLLFVLGVVLLPNFTRTHCCGVLTSCKANLKNIASACEMYAEDHGGYPDSVARLHPRYLETVPHCPSFDDGRSLLWPWQGQQCQAGRRWQLGRTLAVDGCWNWGRSNYLLRSTPEAFTEFPPPTTPSISAPLAWWSDEVLRGLHIGHSDGAQLQLLDMHASRLPSQS